ncbi:uncharacterized protein LOC120265438 [Dioscorea cayenensis subsp. rotundata]|uniref:Uncharacterized protein LOC120265438 n=1 Tax=Dioscorea cayennensis subsp. rotundata TaxID=55577 RepID=A0AB40BRL7_DIOCR|nr:uncharacterized protein LOC120265438 [Dioscorea cayenensis subsp. rotundata]
MEFLITDPPPPPLHPIQNPPPLMDLVAALNHATRSAELLSSSNPSQTSTAIASLRTAHRMLGSLLSHLPPPPPPPPPIDDDQPMADIVEEEDGCERLKIIDEVEEGMRECVLQSKRRRKRHVSPSCPAGREADDLEEEILAVDLEERRRSAMDLVFQFHA